MVNNLKTRLTHYRLGDSLDKAIDMGAIVDESQRKTIEEYVEDARKEGAEVYQATACIPARGCYYPPTIITNVQTVSRVVAEEVGLYLYMYDTVLHAEAEIKIIHIFQSE